ncbi:MAG: hypothetical protein M1511_05325 [Deltaproteobacteria bacterium]|nr:hypothetical protein [Deltaproteobacteria bacterium]
MDTPKQIVEHVLTPATTKKIWVTGYFNALPLTPQGFDMGAVLTAVFYMFRWGKRRGAGKFASTFGKKESTGYSKPTIESVASKVISEESFFSGFNSNVGQAILGDLLLTFCFENKKKLRGRHQQIQRVFPIHYLASWIDLPEHVGHLRYVPELLVSILSGVPNASRITDEKNKSLFPFAKSFEENLLLDLFSPGMKIRGEHRSNMTSDVFGDMDDTASNVGLDQLALIRVAQKCKESPSKARGGGEFEDIPTQQPLAAKATKDFKEDINVFIQAYGSHVPRKAFSIMLESCLSLGFTGIYLATFKMLLSWEKTGELPPLKSQEPWSFFVDCSVGMDQKLRDVAEDSVQNMLKIHDRFPIILMLLRILAEKAHYDRRLKYSLPAESPDGTQFINLLGKILTDNHPCSEKIKDDLEEKCSRLADELDENDYRNDVAQLLRSRQPDSAIRLADGLVNLVTEDMRKKHFMKAFDSLTMFNSPHGLSRKRPTRRKNREGAKTKGDARSIVLTNSMLDFLVHRHCRKAARGKGDTPLSLPEFINILRNRYGLYINDSPPDMSIASELLDRNKHILEKRLRDLGLMMGVNDAESMKRLKQRYRAVGD